MMRDKLKIPEYWKKRIELKERLDAETYNELANNLIIAHRIIPVKQSMVQSHLNIIFSKYSAGYKINHLKEDLLKAINLTDKSWVNNAWNMEISNSTGSIILNQYTLSGYDQMLWMLSLGYLLNIEEADFKKLVEVIDRDSIKDFLFEFIIRAKLKDRKPITQESYEYGWLLFGKLRKAITETNKSKAEKLVKDFITKDWYKEHKDAGWYDNHKSKFDIYSGYWSFETAAVVKIMGLDDSSFIDCPYYPKDLVHQEK